MPRATALSGDGITLRQYVTLRVISLAGGKVSTSEVRTKLVEGGLDVSPTGNLGGLKNMAKVGWITNKLEDRPVGPSGTELPTNVWKITRAGLDALEKAKKLLTVLAKKEK